MSITVTLIMIMKNEEKIIERCLESVRSFVDYIVISDTGSTDNSVTIVEQYLKKNNIKGKVYRDEWKNFGHNRSLSVVNGKKWIDEEKIDPNKNFFITIDCDMVLILEKDFNKNNLDSSDAWLIKQKNSSLTYYNTRLFRSSLPYKCIGVTHEYWSCDNVHPEKNDTLYISDIGDGGCKSDKFERDIRLLTKGLEDEPNNERYFFYLAQSYADLGDTENAVKYYRKRINAGGWNEEIYNCFLRIGSLFMKDGREADAIYEWTLGYNFLPQRGETLYKIINHYRNSGKNFLAFLFLKTALDLVYPKEHILFIEHDVYNYKFVEELSIVSYYTGKIDKGMFACQYLTLTENKGIPSFVVNNARNNLFFYLKELPYYSHVKINFCEICDKYKSSSSCLFYDKEEDSYFGTVRAVNYSIDKNFRYSIRDDNNVVRTKNYWTEKNECYEIVCNVKPVRTSHISGLEDLRITFINNKIYGLAVDWEYGLYNHPSVVITHFGKDENNKYFISKIVPTFYNNNLCQKNWVPFTENNELFAIYSHHPLTILSLDVDTGREKVVVERYSKYNLSNIRGSSIPVKMDDGSWIMLVHEVLQTDTRKYFHRFLRYSSDWNLISISIPFYFKNLFVEFTLSLCMRGKQVSIIFSTCDNSTEIININYEKIIWLPDEIRNSLIF